VVILALPLVTLTPSCLARATISIRFREDTACAILYHDHQFIAPIPSRWGTYSAA
jgi:hypothetical protein